MAKRPSLLRSECAVRVNVGLMRALVNLRRMLAAHETPAKKLARAS